MSNKSSNIPFYMLAMIDSMHLAKMHTLNLCVKDDSIHKPLKHLMDDSTEYTKKLTEYSLELIDGFFTLLYQPFKVK